MFRRRACRGREGVLAEKDRGMAGWIAFLQPPSRRTGRLGRPGRPLLQCSASLHLSIFDAAPFLRRLVLASTAWRRHGLHMAIGDPAFHVALAPDRRAHTTVASFGRHPPDVQPVPTASLALPSTSAAVRVRACPWLQHTPPKSHRDPLTEHLSAAAGMGGGNLCWRTPFIAQPPLGAPCCAPRHRRLHSPSMHWPLGRSRARLQLLPCSPGDAPLLIFVCIRHPCWA